MDSVSVKSLVGIKDKCPRCWKYNINPIGDADICPRCQVAVSQHYNNEYTPSNNHLVKCLIFLGDETEFFFVKVKRNLALEYRRQWGHFNYTVFTNSFHKLPDKNEWTLADRLEYDGSYLKYPVVGGGHLIIFKEGQLDEKTINDMSADPYYYVYQYMAYQDRYLIYWNEDLV